MLRLIKHLTAQIRPTSRDLIRCYSVELQNHQNENPDIEKRKKVIELEIDVSCLFY